MLRRNHTENHTENERCGLLSAAGYERSGEGKSCKYTQDNKNSNGLLDYGWSSYDLILLAATATPSTNLLTRGPRKFPGSRLQANLISGFDGRGSIPMTCSERFSPFEK